MAGLRRVLLAGFGYTARRLAPLLEHAGIGWLAHSRSGRDGALAWDLDDARVGPQLDVTDTGIVYSIAPQQQGTEDPRMHRWLAALRGHPKRLIYLSTTGVYGHRPGELLTETSMPRPAQPRSVRRLSAEQSVAQWCRQHGVPPLIVRLPAIYGPHRLPLERLRRGEPVPDPATAPPGYRIHIDDLAACLLRMLTAELPGGVYLLRDDSDWPLGEWLIQVARLAGLPQPVTVDPATAHDVLSPALMSFATEHRRLDDRLTRRRLGHRLHYPDPQSGIRASLAEMGWRAPDAAC